MKKLTVIIIALISFLAIPAGGEASYRILLKNGGEFKTDRYWKEGEKILFYTDGGVAGMSRSLVQEIRKFDPPYTTEKPPPTTRTADESLEKIDDEQIYKNKAIILSGKVREALGNYKRAKDTGDKERIAEEFQRVSQISSELEDLRKEVQAKNGGILPLWWLEEPERSQ